MFGLNLAVVAGLGIAGLLLLGTAGYQGYNFGYEVAEARGQKKIQAIKDEIVRANALYRSERDRQQREIEALLEARIDYVQRHSEEQRHMQDVINRLQAGANDREKVSREDAEATR